MNKEASSSREPVIEAEDLEITFPGNDWPILSMVNFEVPESKITCVAGPSGIGKSTLMNVAIGRLKPSAGTMRVFGQVVHDISNEEVNQLRKRMGVLYQSGALFQDLTLMENVMFPLVERECASRDEAKEQAQEMLHQVDIDASAFGLTPDRLSGGQKKRGGLARALVTDPDLLLCDEPSSGLDPVTAQKIDRLFLRLHEQNPEQTVLILTHDLNSIKTISDHLVLVHNHREHPEFQSVRTQGSKEQVFSEKDDVVQTFFRLDDSEVAP